MCDVCVWICLYVCGFVEVSKLKFRAGILTYNRLIAERWMLFKLMSNKLAIFFDFLCSMTRQRKHNHHITVVCWRCHCRRRHYHLMMTATAKYMTTQFQHVWTCSRKYWKPQHKNQSIPIYIVDAAEKLYGKIDGWCDFNVAIIVISNNSIAIHLE